LLGGLSSCFILLGIGLESELQNSKILDQKIKSLPPIDSDYYEKYRRFN